MRKLDRLNIWGKNHCSFPINASLINEGWTNVEEVIIMLKEISERIKINGKTHCNRFVEDVVFRRKYI